MSWTSSAALFGRHRDTSPAPARAATSNPGTRHGRRRLETNEQTGAKCNPAHGKQRAVSRQAVRAVLTKRAALSRSTKARQRQPWVTFVPNRVERAPTEDKKDMQVLHPRGWWMDEWTRTSTKFCWAGIQPPVRHEARSQPIAGPPQLTPATEQAGASGSMPSPPPTPTSWGGL